MQNEMQDWPDDEDERIAFVTEGIDRLMEEWGCVQSHWQCAREHDVLGDVESVQAEIYQMTSHLRNLRNGHILVEREIIERFAMIQVVAQLAQDMIEEQTGMIVEMEEFEGVNFHGVMVKLTDPSAVVPDDLSGLEDE